MDDTVEAHNEALLKTLLPGDIIKFPRVLIAHYGIYAGDGMVIHKMGENQGNNPEVQTHSLVWSWNPSASSSRKVSGLSSSSHGNSLLVEQPFFQVAGDSKAEKGNRDDLFAPFGDGAEIVSRARARMHGRPDHYSLLGDNCEHFAFWCRYNVSLSMQVRKLIFSWAKHTTSCLSNLQRNMVGKKTASEVEFEKLMKQNQLLTAEIKSLEEEKERGQIIHTTDNEGLTEEEKRLEEEMKNIARKKDALTKEIKESHTERRKLEEEDVELNTVAEGAEDLSDKRRKYHRETVESMKMRQEVMKERINIMEETEIVIKTKQEMLEELKKYRRYEEWVKREKERLRREEERLVTEIETREAKVESLSDEKNKSEKERLKIEIVDLMKELYKVTKQKHKLEK